MVVLANQDAIRILNAYKNQHGPNAAYLAVVHSQKGALAVFKNERITTAAKDKK